MKRQFVFVLFFVFLMVGLFFWITKSAEEKGRITAEIKHSKEEIQHTKAKYEERKKEEQRREKIFVGANASRDDILNLMRQNMF